MSLNTWFGEGTTSIIKPALAETNGGCLFRFKKCILSNKKILARSPQHLISFLPSPLVFGGQDMPEARNEQPFRGQVQTSQLRLPAFVGNLQNIEPQISLKHKFQEKSRYAGGPLSSQQPVEAPAKGFGLCVE